MNDPFATSVGAQAGSEFDGLFAGAEDAGISERQTGFEPLPAFAFYVFKVIKGSGGLSREKNTPSLKANLEVVMGPEGTVGRRTGILDLIWLTVNRTNKKGEALTDQQYEEKKAGFFATYNRLKTGLELQGYPRDTKSVESLDAYMAPTEGKTFLAELRIEVGNDKVARNKFIADSVERLDAPRTATKAGKKVIVPGTALDEAKEKIQAYNEKASKNAGTAGARKVGGVF